MGCSLSQTFLFLFNHEALASHIVTKHPRTGGQRFDPAVVNGIRIRDGAGGDCEVAGSVMRKQFTMVGGEDPNAPMREIICLNPIKECGDVFRVIEFLANAPAAA